ncbi:putative septum site-determining protein MinC [Fusobacterium gonidiaformans 3-1-5R]|uniref:Putative septum site-determining protein MinC n=1 Tax=Fusobacterium gonidiaformans 3-1-5R TaxID=469605 RepID=E5BFE5_9FUSO|nr:MULTISPECIES: hypothetical protein [Fusobacterium]EFS20826.1 putative septum site-determining protein MinC [Fusobacterium gonidiaformans 3-1-5R]KYM62405.1 hypothetical protein A2U09_10095 [Fusobacterium necrophorum subsp. funduliforme]MDK4471155.1 hypothetical protein [Fusobacterium necrophorum]
MAIKIGAEKKIVFLNVHKPTAVNQATVNVIGAFSTKKAVKEQLVTSIKDVTGLSEEDLLYKKIQAAFIAGAQEILIFGKQIKSQEYKELFDGVTNDWFGTITDEQDLEKIALISKEIAAREKMLFATPAKGTEVNSSLKSSVQAITQDTTALVFSSNEETEDASVAGYAIPQFPGSILIANKLINGAVDSGYSGAEQGILKGLNCNYQARMKGQLGLAEGVTMNGDSIDFIHCAKALKFRLEEDITLWLKATPKPTFYDTSSLKATILKRTGQFEAMGALAEGKTNVRLIDVADIPANDILKGIYSGIKITCYYTYGIKEAKIDLYFAI